MSSRDPSQESGGRVSRVLKADAAAGIRFAFPVLGGSTAPKHAIAVDVPTDEGMTATLPAPVPLRHPESARQTPEVVATEMVARARALERRAAAILAESEDAALARLREAEGQAQAALAVAVADVESIRATARDEGKQEGYAAAFLEGQEAGRIQAEALLSSAQTDADSLMAEAASASESLHRASLAEREALLESAKLQLLELAFAMARQVVKAELGLAPEAMLPMLEAALAKMKGEEEPQVRVNPAVLALLEEHRGRLVAAAAGARRIVAEPDPGLEPGDFVVQASQGVVDGRVDRQIEVLERQVRNAEER